MNTPLQNALILTVDDIREQFNRADVGHMNITITISGHTYKREEIKVEYRVGEYCSYDESNARGNDLNAAVKEFLRRKGWDIVNTVKALPAPEVERNFDEEPF